MFGYTDICIWGILCRCLCVCAFSEYAHICICILNTLHFPSSYPSPDLLSTLLYLLCILGNWAMQIMSIGLFTLWLPVQTMGGAIAEDQKAIKKEDLNIYSSDSPYSPDSLCSISMAGYLLNWKSQFLSCNLSFFTGSLVSSSLVPSGWWYLAVTIFCNSGFPEPCSLLVNSTFIKVLSEYPNWVCHLFPAETLTNTIWPNNL